MSLSMFLYEGTEPLASWTNANQVFNYIQKNILKKDIQNGEYYEITFNELEDLNNSIKQVLLRNRLAGNLLPTLAGPGFGSTEYDAEYFQQLSDISDTLDYITDVQIDVEYNLIFMAWW